MALLLVEALLKRSIAVQLNFEVIGNLIHGKYLLGKYVDLFKHSCPIRLQKKGLGLDWILLAIAQIANCRTTLLLVNHEIITMMMDE